MFGHTCFICIFNVGYTEKGEEATIVDFGTIHQFMQSCNFPGYVGCGENVFYLVFLFDCKPPVSGWK